MGVGSVRCGYGQWEKVNVNGWHSPGRRAGHVALAHRHHQGGEAEVLVLGGQADHEDEEDELNLERLSQLW